MRPIINIVEQIHHDLMEQKEEAIIKAVSKFDVVVDKERLMQALKDAKAFYDEGYYEGMSMGVAIAASVVCCRECKFAADRFGSGILFCSAFSSSGDSPRVKPDEFCSRGERRVE